MARNKQRVFVNIHVRQCITLTDEGIQLGHARFHWSLWVQDKYSNGAGHEYDARDGDPFSNVPTAGEWQFKHREDDWNVCGNLKARILVGKLPPGVGVNGVADVLKEIALPQKGVEPVQGCVAWTEAAIGKLQELGWVNEFDVRQFMDYAHEQATQYAYHDGRVVLNYTKRPLEETTGYHAWN